MYHVLYIFTLLFIKLFSLFSEIIKEYSLWINYYTYNCGICMKCYTAMARSKRGRSDPKGIVREFFIDTRDRFHHLPLSLRD